MAKETQRKHPPDALLHAYVAGELDPATRAAIISHLGRCGECRETSSRVEGLRALITEHQPQGFDELKWRRISQGVMNQLETEALSQHTFGNGSRTQWTIAALAAAAAVALLVWFAPRPQRPKVTHEAAPPPIASAPTITSGDTPFEVQLPPGLQLHLSEGATLVARSTVPTDIDFELQLGMLDVRAIAPIDPSTPIKVRTPDFVALGRSTDFSVGYHAEESFVAVRNGEVELDPGDKIVKKGETHTIRHQEKTAVILEEEEPPREKLAVVKKRVEVEPKREEEPQPIVESDEEPGGPKPIDRAELAKPAQEPAPTQKMSSEGETSVKVIPPPEDQWTLKLRLANEAYSARRYDKALILATEIVEHAGMRGEVALARQMLCDLYITTKQSDRAVVACTALLSGATDEEARAIHRHLATIYRKDLNDCKTAIVHYTQAIVFGRASPFDEEPLIWRAHCELEVGDLKAARADINALERRAASLVRPAELAALKKRLLQASQR